MNINLLKKGDVILLEKGMTVYATVPFPKWKTEYQEMITDKPCEADLIVGEIIKNTIPNKEFNEYQIEPGDYVVVKVKKELSDKDEEIQMRLRGNDYYASGYEVYCERLTDGVYNKKGFKIRFYQTGDFTAMIENIKPIGHIDNKKAKIK